MLKKTSLIKSAMGFVALVAIAKAAPLTLTQMSNVQGDLNWQEIVNVSASFIDDGDNLLEVGEEVTFTVTMDKQKWGSHDFDALKIFTDKLPGVESAFYTEDYFTWDFNGANNGLNKDSDWTGGTESFSKTVTFYEAGDWGMAASVLCSRDLSGFSDENGLNVNFDGNRNDVVTQSDISAWVPDVQQNKIGWNGYSKRLMQGETETYSFTVSSKNVPEPGILAFLGCGILSLAFVRRKN